MPYRVVIAAALAWFVAHAQAVERNLLSNPSFELVSKGKPLYWNWRQGRAKASFTVDATVARSGRYSLKLTNLSPQSPHVYSSLVQRVDVLPNRQYTVSCYVKTEAGGRAWIGKWGCRVAFPAKTQGWRRVSGSFKTQAGERSVSIMILTESPTEALWVDDVQLERGPAASPFVATLPIGTGTARLVVTPQGRRENLVPNSSFEIVDGVRPKFWMLDKRNTDAAMTIDDTVAHSGQRSIKFTNGTPFGAQVYGWFGVVGGIRVKPDTPYTVSAFVMSQNPGTAWVGGATGWRVRCQFYPTRGKWVRVQQSFVTKSDETSIPFMIVTESPTGGFWVDDIKLEEGWDASPYVDRAAHDQAIIEIGPWMRPAKPSRYGAVEPYWAPSKYPPEACYFSSGGFRADGAAYLPKDIPNALVRVRLMDPAGKLAAKGEATLDLKAGAWRIRFEAAIEAEENGEYEIEAVLLQGNRTLARGSRRVRLYTKESISRQIDLVGALAGRLRRLVDSLAEKRLDAYPRVTLTVLENFSRWAQEDLANDHADRAWDAAVVMENLARRRIAQAQALLAGRGPALRTQRYTTQPLRIDGPSFIGDQWLASQKAPPQSRPFFFVGYGHFGQVRKDVEKFPAYGCNMIQIEFGPRSVLPKEGVVSDAAINDFLAVCDRAAKANVAVNLLLSPHYCPQWALEKWPHLKDCSGGFFKYCVHAPEARGVLEKFLRRVIPRIKDHPALHSLCLSNEPIDVKLSKCRYIPAMWREWLRKKHGDVATLNRRWGSKYASFQDVPVPAGNKYGAGPLAYDFTLFNQEQFAAFHKWMADVIHSMAPRVPVHAKIMMSAHFRKSLHGIWSVSPELFGQLSQINGNDLCRWYRRRGEWTSGWLRANMACDFQRSVADKPIFNSENHIIVDRDLDVIPPQHVYSTLWQEAVHGQSATTIWVWQRTYNPASSAAGSIMHRPDSAEAVGRACLDLNRLAPQVTALQRVRPQILVFWSLASIVQGNSHDSAVCEAYEALSFLGVPLGFVTERQLARDAAGETPLPLRSAKVIVVPQATHVPDASLAALAKFKAAGGKVVCVGECFGFDEYKRARKPARQVGERIARPETSAELHQAFESLMSQWGVERRVRATDGRGNSAWGVEVRYARRQGRWIVNLCNHTRVAATVRLQLDGKPVGGMNLLTGMPVGKEIFLEPMAPMLVAVEPQKVH